MGYTFAAALVKKTGAPGKTPTAPATRKAIREGFEHLGYTKAANAEDATLRLPLHHDKKSAWLTIALEMPERLNAQLELLRKLAAAMHTPILYFMNFDSDFLYVAATDGATVQHVHVGFIDEDDDDPENAECMQDRDDLSVFDALLPDDTARAEFRRILAVEERVFSEEAAQEMATLFGYTPEALFIAEDAEPFAVLAFNEAGRDAVPFLMPEDAPPAFRGGCLGWGNPAYLSLSSCGGAGKGIRIVMQAEGYDAKDWDACCVYLDNTINRNFGYPAPVEYGEKVVPKRVAFQDGSAGWVAEFPEAPVFRGVNPKSPAATTMRALNHTTATGYSLRLAFNGGTFRQTPPEEPIPQEGNGPNAARLQEFFQAQQEFYTNNPEVTHVWIIPMENPKASIHHSIPREPLRKGRGNEWLEGYLPEEGF